MIVKYVHHDDDLVEHRTREASFGAQCTNHSANSMCSSRTSYTGQASMKTEQCATPDKLVENLHLGYIIFVLSVR